jgi:hypothetical protein
MARMRRRACLEASEEELQRVRQLQPVNQPGLRSAGVAGRHGPGRGVRVCEEGPPAELVVVSDVPRFARSCPYSPAIPQQPLATIRRSIPNRSASVTQSDVAAGALVRSVQCGNNDHAGLPSVGPALRHSLWAAHRRAHAFQRCSACPRGAAVLVSEHQPR